MSRATPVSHRLANAIRRNAANRYAALSLPLLTARNALDAPIGKRHEHVIRSAFLMGATFELDRLSNATRVDLRGLSKKAIFAGASRWFSNVRRSNTSACHLSTWSTVLVNSFEMGADFIDGYLWPAQPHLGRRRR